MVGDAICSVSCDAIVSPANSFGFMDGGLDHLISERFGCDFEKQVQKAIQERPMQVLLVGEALVIPTRDPAVPWLICAPTMRIPSLVCISVNTYLAMKAILVATTFHSLNTIAVPGLGTGSGQLAPEIAAGQMAQAYREIILKDFKCPCNFVEAQIQQLQLNRTSMMYD